jgi:hypothetical protein
MNIYYSNEALNHSGKGFTAPLFAIGFSLILMGILIIMFPMVLAVITAALLFGLGVVILGLAWKFRRSNHNIFHYHII